MICYIKKSFKTNNVERVLQIPLLLISDNDATMGRSEDPILVPSIFLVTSEDVYSLFSREKFKFTVVDGVDVPIPLCSGAGGDVTQVYNYVVSTLEKLNVSKLPDNVKQNIVDNIKDKFKAFGDGSKIVAGIISATEAFLEYIKQSDLGVIISLPPHTYDDDYYSEVTNLITNLNGNIGNPFSSIKPKDNVTLYQNKVTDPVFFRLPTNADMISKGSIDLLDFLPKPSDICSPYTNENATSIDYRDPGMVLPSELPLIEGTAENSYLPIQPNEEMLYTALCEWIAYNARKHFDMDVSDENIVVDPDTELFLERVMERAYLHHWRHVKYVPIRMSDVVDNGDVFDDIPDDAGEESEFVFRLKYVDESKVLKNAYIILHDFVKMAYNKLGYRVYAEAIVKMLRWGERKPKYLYIEGFDTMYDLGEVKELSYIGNIHDYEVKTVNGNEYTINDLIYSDVVPKTAIGGVSVNSINFPVGVIAVKILVNKVNTAKENIVLYEYIPIVDLIRKLENGEKYNGIEIDETGEYSVLDYVGNDRTLTYSSLKTDYTRNRSSYLADPFYRSEELQRLFFSLGVPDVGADEVKVNHFSILESKIQNPRVTLDIEKNKFTTKEELKDKVASWEITSKSVALELQVFNEYIKVYSEMFKLTMNKDLSDIEEVFSLWSRALKASEYTGEASFLSDGTSVLQKDNSRLKSMNMFDSNEEEFGVNMIKPIIVGTVPNIYRIRGFTTGSTVGIMQIVTEEVGGKSSNKQILGSIADAEKLGVDITKLSEVSIVHLIPRIINNSLGVNRRREDMLLIYYHSEESIIALSSALTLK